MQERRTLTNGSSGGGNFNISLSETTKTVSAAAGNNKITIFIDEEPLLDSAVAVTYSGIITSATYDNSTGYINYSYSSNTDTSNTRTGYIFATYRGNLVTFTLTQSKDSVSGTTRTATSFTLSSCSVDPMYNFLVISNNIEECTVHIKGTITYTEKNTYVSGRTTTETKTNSNALGGTGRTTLLTWKSKSYYAGFSKTNLTISYATFNIMATTNSSSASYSLLHKTSAFSGGKLYLWYKVSTQSSWTKLGTFTLSWNGQVTGESDVSASYS